MYIVRYVKIPTCSEAPIAINSPARVCAKARTRDEGKKSRRANKTGARGALMAFTYECKLRIATGRIDVSQNSFGFSLVALPFRPALPSFYNRTARVQ